MRATKLVSVSIALCAVVVGADSASAGGVNVPTNIPKVNVPTNIPKVSGSTNIPKVNVPTNIPKVSGSTNIPKVNVPTASVVSKVHVPRDSARVSVWKGVPLMCTVTSCETAGSRSGQFYSKVSFGDQTGGGSSSGSGAAAGGGSGAAGGGSGGAGPARYYAPASY